MVLLRRTLLFVLLFSFCLTVCVLPVSAGLLDEFSCVVNLQPQTFGLYESLGSSLRHGFSSVPASFTYSFDDGTNIYSWDWDAATALTSIDSIVTMPNKEIQFIVNVGDGSGELPVDLEYCSFDFLMRGYEGNSFLDLHYPLDGYAVLESDSGDFSYTIPSGEYEPFPVFQNLSFSCSQYFSVTYYSSSKCYGSESGDFDAVDQILDCKLKLLVEGESVSLDSISIQIENLHNTVTDIGNDVGDIKATVENIQEGVVEINGTVTDMKEQLEDSSSPIWSAAGDKISEALTDLFVPDPQQIADVKQGFDNLAKDKLGGAYTAMETVDDTVKDVSNKLHNPNGNVAIEFPGISVPLGGEVGTVVLAERQFVTLPTQITAILHPVSGTIFTFICGLGTLNVLKDMVECFLSGYSYAEYLHRNKGGSDE